jgi:SAM-dependent methyltransferase
MANERPAKSTSFSLNSPLALPALYTLFREGIGGAEVNRTYVREFIQPFPNARILDIGCGPGVILDYLPRYVEYVGYDINPRYIRFSQKKHGARGSFHCSDVGKLPEFGKFDIVLATGVLHHLDDHEAAALLKTAADQLRPGGYLVTFDNAYVEGQARLARWLISMDRGKHVRTPEGYQDLARPFFSTLQSAVRHDLLRIPYTHFIVLQSE